MGSKNKPKKAAEATAGKSNTKRELADIAGDIHALERRNVFDIGKLLIEAHDGCEHGEWGDWLDREFDWSDDTADNYMAAARLADKFRTVRDLKVPMRIIYDLDDLDDPDLPAIIEALAKASKSKPISVVDAEEVISLTGLRVQFGDYPATTLYALSMMSHFSEDEWAKQASEKLKEVKPTTDEEARRIIDTCRPPEVEPDEQDEPPSPPPPWPPSPRSAPPPPRREPITQETDPAHAAAADAARNDIGPLSQAEHARLTRMVDDLANLNVMHKAALTGRNSEIARLEEEVKTLKGADLPTLTIDKHVEALAALLKKVSREKQELVIEELCRKLGLDPQRLNISEAA
jgi:hypothetical protein